MVSKSRCLVKSTRVGEHQAVGLYLPQHLQLRVFLSQKWCFCIHLCIEISMQLALDLNFTIQKLLMCKKCEVIY